jgi:hypothetical protein
MQDGRLESLWTNGVLLRVKGSNICVYFAYVVDSMYVHSVPKPYALNPKPLHMLQVLHVYTVHMLHACVSLRAIGSLYACVSFRAM